MTAQPTALTVLLIEDNACDARLVRELLSEVAWLDVTVVHVDRLAAALAYLGGADAGVTLLDLSLPDAQGLENVARLHACAPGLPIVIMSGCDDEALALEGVRVGAQDYLVKGRVESDGLARALRYAVERKRIQDSMAGYARDLEARTREQEALIYTMSHDLKAPLVSLQGMSSLLRDDYADLLDPAGMVYLDRITANARKMHALLDDLLLLSRAGMAEEDGATADLNVVVAEVTEQLRHTLAVRRARINVVGRLPVVHAGFMRMEQVFANLIANAVAYTPVERAPLIRIEAIDRQQSWEILVRDNGIGIAPAFHNKVLRIFQRLPEGKDLNPNGTGAGLAIVARIVEAHGGRLWIESDGAHGTTMHVTLAAVEDRGDARPAACLASPIVAKEREKGSRP